jgi:PPE-repeat protein
MDYLILPPEINSARIESGPGSGPLIAASAAWLSIADELASASTQMAASLDSLTSAWAGSASAIMTAAVGRYNAWVMQTAEMASRTADSAMMAASAYETARGASVPLAAVLANRTQLASLVATNFLGINTPAIMATEAAYAEMWAQDVSAMVGYQAESAAATAQLQPAAPAPQVTTGSLAQGVSQAAATTTLPTGLQSILSFLTSPNNFLTALGNPATPIGFVEAQELALQSSGVWQSLSYPLILGLQQQANSIQSEQAHAQEEGNAIARQEQAGGLSNAPGAGLAAPETAAQSATLGEARSVGSLSVPPSWDKSTQQVRLASAATPLEPAGRMGGMMPMPIAAVGAPERKQRKGEDLLVRVKFVPTEGV